IGSDPQLRIDDLRFLFDGRRLSPSAAGAGQLRNGIARCGDSLIGEPKLAGNELLSQDGLVKCFGRTKIPDRQGKIGPGRIRHRETWILPSSRGAMVPSRAM